MSLLTGTENLYSTQSTIPTSTLKRSNANDTKSGTTPTRNSFSLSRSRNFSTNDLSLRRPVKRDVDERPLKRSSSGSIRHGSDSMLYSSATNLTKQNSGRRLNEVKKNAEFSLQAGTSLCLAQRAGAGGIRALIETILEKSPQANAHLPDEVTEADNLSTEDSAEATDIQSGEDDTRVPEPPTSECNVLSKWAFEPYYRVVITSSGGIPAIVQAMRAHPNSSDLQTAACRAFANLCTGSATNQKVVRAEGGLDVIQDAMKLHPDNGVLSSAACSALRALNVDIDMQ